MINIRMGDVWGGLSASALVLPQAMAFGIALWSPYTHDPAAAAMSGLMAAACLCIVSGIFRGTEGLVAAPTGPTLVLLAGAIAALSASGLVGDVLITATLLTIAMAGVFQILIGALKLGHLIKYILYPVVSGFMTGIGVIILITSILPAMGYYPGTDKEVIENMKPHAEELILDRILNEEAQDEILVLEEFRETISRAENITDQDILDGIWHSPSRSF